MEEDGTVILRLHGDFLIILGAQGHTGVGSHGLEGLFASLVEDTEVGKHLHRLQSRDGLHHVDPVGADVTEGAALTAENRVKTPAEVGVEIHPVLQVAAVDGVDLAHLAALHHGAALHHLGIPAAVEVDGVDDVVLLGVAAQLLGLLHGSGQGLLANHGDAPLHGVHRHFIMGVVGGADVDNIGLFDVQHLPVVGIALGHTVCRGFSLGVRRVGNSHNIHIPQAAKGLNMGGADKSDTDNTGSESFHEKTSLLFCFHAIYR